MSNLACRLALIAAVTLGANVAKADVVDVYTLTGGQFVDGAGFTGNWTVDLTTATLISATFTKGAGTSTAGTETGPSPAAAFTTSNTLNFNIAQSVSGLTGIDQINIYDTTGNQLLHFDFVEASGDIYAGNGVVESTDDWVTSGGNPNFSNYVALFPTSGNPQSTVTVPEPTSLALLIAGISGLAAARRRKA